MASDSPVQCPLSTSSGEPPATSECASWTAEYPTYSSNSTSPLSVPSKGWPASLKYQDIIPDTIAKLPLLRLPTSPSVRGPDSSVGESPTDPLRRRICDVVGCTSQARAYGKCKRHGGSKRCEFLGCTKSVQSRGMCIRHGGGSRCIVLDCNRAAQSKGRCKLHGGGRPCLVEGCEKKAHMRQLCRQHGGGAKCASDNCDKWAQRNGLCLLHAKRVDEDALAMEAAANIVV